MFWRRFMEMILNVVVTVGIISSFIWVFVVLSATDSFLSFLLVLLIGVLITLMSCGMMGLIIEAVKHLEDILESLESIRRTGFTTN